MADTKQTPAKATEQAKTAGIVPNVLALVLTERIGRRVTAKRVRSVARDYVQRFMERTGYTAHVYTPDEAATIAEHIGGSGRGEHGADQAETARLLAAAMRKDGTK